MTLYQKLEKLQKLQIQLEKWKNKIDKGVIMSRPIVNILEKLIIQITILKIELGIKIKL